MYNTNTTTKNRERTQEAKITKGTRHRTKINRTKTQHSLVNVGDRGENVYVGGKNAVSFEIWLLRSSEQGGGDDCRMFVVVTST